MQSPRAVRWTRVEDETGIVRAKGVSRRAGEEESNVSVGSDTLGRGRTRPWFPTDQIRPRLDMICMELIQLTGREDSNGRSRVGWEDSTHDVADLSRGSRLDLANDRREERTKSAPKVWL